MIIQNKTYEVGDVLEIEVRVNRRGVYSLTSFFDDTSNEDLNSYFHKTVQVSIDNGITYTPEAEVSNSAISLTDVQVTSTNNIVYLFRYTVAGSNPIEPLEFNSLTLEGTITITINNQIIVHTISISGRVIDF